MSCTRFQATRSGGLSIFREGQPLLHLWAHEVARLRSLLDRPGPIGPTRRAISDPFGCQVVVVLWKTGTLTLEWLPDDPTIPRIELGNEHVNDLRATLGILEPRPNQSYQDMAYMIRENYGDPTDRMQAITRRVARAQRRAWGRVTVQGV